MPSKHWKNVERNVCRRFGGERRGADFGDGRLGKNDCVGTPGYSIEVKVWERPFFQMMLDEARRAEEHRERPTDIPLAIIKRKGDPEDDALVIIRLGTFEETLKKRFRERILLNELGYEQ